MPAADYDGVVDGMFHMIRQNAAGCAAVLIRMLDVLTAVAHCEHASDRRGTLERHTELVLADVNRTVGNASDLHDLRARHTAVVRATQ